MLWIKRIIISVIITLSTTVAAQQLILDGNAIDLDSNTQVIVEANGNVTVTSTDGDLMCQSDVPLPTASLIFTNNNTSAITVPSGGNATVRWTHQFAESCEARQGNAAWRSTNVSNSGVTTTLTNLTSNLTLELFCSNASGTQEVSETATISIQSTGGGGNFAGFNPPADCAATAPPPVGTVRNNPLGVGLTAGVNVVNNFEGFFGDMWPGLSNVNIVGRMIPNQYVAIGFNTGDLCTGAGCDRLAGGFSYDPSAIGNGLLTVSISRCPGDFSSALGNCRMEGLGTFNWAYSPFGNSCVLEQGQQYFLNAINAAEDDPSTTSCTNSTGLCGWLVKPTN